MKRETVAIVLLYTQAARTWMGIRSRLALSDLESSELSLPVTSREEGPHGAVVRTEDSHS